VRQGLTDLRLAVLLYSPCCISRFSTRLSVSCSLLQARPAAMTALRTAGLTGETGVMSLQSPGVFIQVQCFKVTLQLQLQLQLQLRLQLQRGPSLCTILCCTTL